MNVESTTGMYGGQCAYDVSTGKVIVVYRQNSTTYSLRVGTVSGTSISWGSAQNSTTASTTIRQAIIAENGHVTFSGGTKLVVGSYSGNTITFGSEQTIPFSNGDTACDYLRMAFDPNTGTYMIGGARNATGNLIEVFGATRSGTTLTFGSGLVISTDTSTNYSCCYAGAADKFFWNWGEGNPGTAGYTTVVQVAGTTSSKTESHKFLLGNNEGTMNSACVNNSADGTVVLAWSNYGDGKDGWYYVEGMRNTNGTRGGFVGFSNAAYTNGQTAKVSIAGAVSTNQVGLTTAQPYYLKGDGTLDPSPASGDFLVGNALSATNLLLR